MWIIHPKPVEDELLSSWMLRVCRLRGVRPFSFTNLHWPQLIRWNTDIDLGLYPELVSAMAEGTGTPIERARATTLDSLLGVMFERWSYPNAAVHWVLWARRRGRRTGHWGLCYCPDCLAGTDAYRRSWRLAWSTACPRHGCWLRDACPVCDAPVEPAHAPAATCVECGADLLVPTDPADPEAVALAVEAEAAIRSGWGRVGWVSRAGLDGWPAVVWFDVLRQLCKTLVCGTRAATLRTVVAERFGGDPRAPTTAKGRAQIEGLRVGDRGRCMGLASRLLARWPDGLVEALSEAGVWRSWLLRDWDEARFPLVDLADWSLSPPTGNPWTAMLPRSRVLAAARMAAPLETSLAVSVGASNTNGFRGSRAFIRADAGTPAALVTRPVVRPAVPPGGRSAGLFRQVERADARTDLPVWLKRGMRPTSEAGPMLPGLRVQVAASIAEARMRAGISPETLARRMKMPTATVKRLEVAKRLPSIATIQKVAQATGQTIVLELS